MPARRRNVIVGLVVLIGLAILVWMLLLFAGQATAIFTKKGIHITLTSDRADGVSDGSNVYYRGVNVGRVTSVARENDNEHVKIVAELDRDPPLPSNLAGVIRTTSALGSSAQISLELLGDPAKTFLSDGDQLQAKYVGLEFFPESITGLAGDIRQQKFVQHLDDTVISIRQQAERAGQVLDSVQKLVSDPKIQENIRQSVANIRTATESANRIGARVEKLADKMDTLSDTANVTVTRASAHVDELSRQASTDVEKLGKVLDQFQESAAKINDGKGTAGLLINDPKLYNSLVDTVKTLNGTVQDLQRVIEQWEQEGVPLKLGK